MGILLLAYRNYFFSTCSRETEKKTELSLKRCIVVCSRIAHIAWVSKDAQTSHAQGINWHTNAHFSCSIPVMFLGIMVTGWRCVRIQLERQGQASEETPSQGGITMCDRLWLAQVLIGTSAMKQGMMVSLYQGIKETSVCTSVTLNVIRP